ncbi:Na+/H+ antiporter NhaC family protein [Bacillus sp. JJ1562]|uniref:Na+/H+ antiporter NhaC family protein n=1 Tax=Bacillus sp. JJ1562 TaxID=3122960 RepID=UPI0030034417
MNKDITNVQFYGGRFVSLIPFGIFITIAIIISLLKAPDLRGMWVAALVGIMVTYFLSKEKEKYSMAVIEGMADKIAIIPVVCWIFAGVFAQVLKESGLVDGILWAAYHIGATGTFFVIIAFVASALFATATGTSFGTIIAGISVLYPAGILLGADPIILAGAIVGGAAFGDNIAPISDTTIASAASQDADVGGVVKSRIKYVIPATIITIILIAIFGGGGSSQEVLPYEQLSKHMNPLGLVMIIPAIITIIFAVKGAHLISATTIGTVVGIIIAHLFNLNSFSNLFYIQDGAVQGVFVNGVAGMVDICIFALLIMACVNIMKVGKGDKALMSIAEKFISTARGVEASIGALTLALTSVMGLNAPPILAIGVSYAKPMAEKYRVYKYRIANILDAFANTLCFIVPWSPALFLVKSLSEEANGVYGEMVPILSTGQLGIWIIYCWALLAVMIFSVITGWGRTYVGSDGEPVKSLALAEDNKDNKNIGV